MCRARWNGGRRYRLPRLRYRPCKSQGETDVQAEHSCFPSLRGGAITGKAGGSNKLLAILSKCLAEYESERDPAANGVDSEQQLLEELQKMVQRQPKNLLQELKALVAKFTRAKAEKRHSHWNGASMQPKNDWVTVVRGKPKRLTNAEKRPAVNQQLPGKLRADDWNAKIAQTSDELEKLLKTEKKVVLAPVKSEYAADMWTLLKAFPAAKATLVLPESFPVHELPTSLNSTSCIARVPMLVRGAIVQPKVCLLTKGGADAPQFDRKEVSIKSDAKKVETVFLRAATRRDLVANFERLQRNPGQSVRSWI